MLNSKLLPVLLFFLYCSQTLFANDDDLSVEELLTYSVQKLLTVTVASKREESVYDAPAVLSLTSDKEIALFNDRNLRQTLNRMPGVYTGGSFHLWPQNTASVRGDFQYQNNRTLVLINGRPARESHDGGKNHPFYLNFPIEILQQVEVIRGPGSVLYGSNAFNSVINLKLKDAPDQPMLTMRASKGSFGYTNVVIHGGTSSGDFGMYTALRLENIDGWPYQATDEIGVTEQHDYRQRSSAVVTHLNYKELTLDLFASASEDFILGPAPIWAISPDNQNKSERLFADLGYRFDLMGNWQLELHATVNYQSNEFFGPGGPERPLSEDILGEVTLHGLPIEGLNVIAGYVVEQHESKESSGAALPAKYSRSPQSAYAQLDYKIVEEIKLIVGLQWNKPEFDDVAMIYRIGTVINFTEYWGSKILYSEAFRSPSGVEQFLDVPVAVGNPDLGPETVITQDLQIFYRGDKGDAALTYFRSVIKNQIGLLGRIEQGRSILDNGDNQKIWGLEAEAKHYFLSKLLVSGSVAYQENEQDGVIDESPFPNWIGKLGVSFQSNRWSSSLFYEFYDTPPLLDNVPDINPVPGSLHLIAINAEWDVAHWFDIKPGLVSLTLKGENILDEDINYPEIRRRNIKSLPGGSGLAFYGGLRLKF
ncbi:MAG: hypothetical protein COA99_18940 [Moraxellaceae bacterium]|nr:MAG: hypothetical protein COA99_18940 [Moraxellaceae bacterium]